jgi:hypothetical protein
MLLGRRLGRDEERVVRGFWSISDSSSVGW